MKIRQLRHELWLPRPLAEVFPFFAEAANLEILTPSSLKFRIQSARPIVMRVGTLIDYRIVVRGLPFRWQSEITAWEPPVRFVDEQRRGPYRLWQHEHKFVERDGATTITDTVRYAVPFDFLAHRWLVRPEIERIFAFRAQKMRELFSATDSAVPERTSES